MDQYKKEFIRFINNFSKFSTTQLALFNSVVKTQNVSKNEYFIRAGDKPEKFAFVNKGIFRVYCISKDGNEKTMAFRSEGQFIAAYTPLLFDQNVWYYIQALTDCNIYYLSISDYQKLSSNHISWQVLEKNYIVSLFKEKEERERSLLMDCAETRYKSFIKDNKELAKRIQQNYIASYLGITPVSLSRLKSKKNS